MVFESLSADACSKNRLDRRRVRITAAGNQLVPTATEEFDPADAPDVQG